MQSIHPVPKTKIKGGNKMGSQIKIFIDRDKLLKKVYLRDKYEIVSRQNVDDTVFNEFVYTLLNYDKESELEDE